MTSSAVMFRWARYGAWTLLGAGLLVLIANAVWGREWGPLAVALIVGGYGLGVLAILPVLGRVLRAAVNIVAALARRARLRGSGLR